MALPKKYDGAGIFWTDGAGPFTVVPAKIDEMLLEALEALEQTHRLHQDTPNPETKRQTRRIIENLHSALFKLAPLGIHSAKRLERMRVIS